MSIVSGVISLLVLVWSINKWLQKPAANKNLPPSPMKLPIVGNLHQLGSLPHYDLQRLANKHGPLMLLHFGSVPVLIVSSAEIAREIMRTHDLVFVNRPLFKVYKKILYGGRDVAFAPYGEYWKQMKSIFVLQLLSNKRVQSFRFIREEETALLVEKIRRSAQVGSPVNLSKMFDESTNDVVCRSAFGRKMGESDHVKKFLILLPELTEVMGKFDIGDFIPWLDWVSRVTGVDKRVDKVAKLMDHILDAIIQEHIQESAQLDKQQAVYFVDILLQIYNNNDNNSNSDIPIDRDSIKALIFDVFVGGTESISSTLEWAMTELLRHPTAMEKLRKEIREIAKDKEIITDDELEKMHYLKAVIKETFRYHPPGPLLAPKLGCKDVKIKGYDISAGTVVMINALAIGRHSVSWDDPEKFKPERFLNSSVDFKGADFELIPFGAGRRKCPGITYANATIEYVLANLVHKFNWELPDGEDVDVKESPGITVRKIVPLLALATQIN